MATTEKEPLKVKDSVMWDLKQGESFIYAGSSVVWKCKSVNNSDNRDISVTIESKKSKRTIYLMPFYTQKGQHMAHYGDRWIQVFL